MTATQPSKEHADLLAAGNEALSRGNWATARGIFDALVAAAPTAEALDGQGWAAWWQDDADVVFVARERAYQLYREAGDNLGAARMAAWLGNDYLDFRGDTAISNGWIRIAQRLLDELPTASEHGWMAVLLADLALMLEEDTVKARKHAQAATAIGRQVRDRDVEVMGRTIEGLALVTEGDMAQGMALLDEAAAEAVNGTVHELAAVSFILCHLVFACERARDFERATQWCERTQEYADRVGFAFAQGTCRVHYAGILLWRGMWAEAERELADASRYLTQSRPPWEAEARVRLAELRRRQGRTEEAEALFREVDWHPLASLGLAEVALEAGRYQEAEEYARRVLRAVPERSISQRAAGLEVLIRVLAAAGQPDQATGPIEEFQRIAAAIGTLPLRGELSNLSGLVAAASGRHDVARGHLEDAIGLFERCRALHETALARLALAEVFLRQGRRERSRQEASAALRVLEALGASVDAARARALTVSAESPTSARAQGVLTGRQLEIIRLVAQGMSDREIASALVMSEHTVHRHIANILQRLDLPSRSAAVAQASKLGLL